MPRPSLRLTGVFVAVLGVGLAAGWLLSTWDADVAEVGAPAPDFTVEIIGGGSFTLSERLTADQKPIVLSQWASWCVPCRIEIPELSAFALDNPEVVVLGVAVSDTEPRAIEFAEEVAASYDMAIGNTAFEASSTRIGLPITHVIDEAGTVREIFNGILNQQTLEELVAGL